VPGRRLSALKHGQQCSRFRMAPYRRTISLALAECDWRRRPREGPWHRRCARRRCTEPPCLRGAMQGKRAPGTSTRQTKRLFFAPENPDTPQALAGCTGSSKGTAAPAAQIGKDPMQDVDSNYFLLRSDPGERQKRHFELRFSDDERPFHLSVRAAAGTVVVNTMRAGPPLGNRTHPPAARAPVPGRSCWQGDQEGDRSLPDCCLYSARRRSRHVPRC